jgi:hypothetical protein
MTAETSSGQQLTTRSVALTGLEMATWGSVPRHTSALATLALVAERLGDDVSYDGLMGASGAAFRIQMADGKLCPSSSHASCGFDCRQRAIELWGRRFERFDLGAAPQVVAGAPHDTSTSDDDATRSQDVARRAVIASLERGVPATYDSEESSLIVGYTENGLLIRPNAARANGYSMMDRWPWSISVALSGAMNTTSRERVLVESCLLARELFEAPRNGHYHSGRAAYRHWAELLSDDAAFTRSSPQALFIALLGNAHTLQGLGDARGAASRYTRDAAESARGPARAALERASATYAELAALVQGERKAVAPYPWELGDPSRWSTEQLSSQWAPQQRQRQIELLSHARALDEHAVDNLSAAARALPG